MGKTIVLKKLINWNIFKSIPQPQDTFVALTAMVAVGVGSIAVDLQDIPNQPIRFMVDLFYYYIFREILLHLGWSNK